MYGGLYVKAGHCPVGHMYWSGGLSQEPWVLLYSLQLPAFNLLRNM